jgi:hypothetical protein
VVVSHREARIDVFRRADDGTWARAEEARSGARAKLASIACELDVDDVYRDPFVK